MNLLLAWLLNALAVLVAAYLLPGVTVSSFGVALIVALVLGIINITLKPLMLLVTLPINVLTLGLFTFVINAIVILIAAKLVDGFKVDGFLIALLFSLVLGLVNALLGSLTE